jgi:hypothetical protein
VPILDSRLHLTSLHCVGGSAHAAAHLWTVFFKVDATTVAVTPDLRFSGRATVIGTDRDDDATGDVAIPVALGCYRTPLRPIPLPAGPAPELAGVLGAALVVLATDYSPVSAIAAGHRALQCLVRRALDALIPTLTAVHEAGPPADDPLARRIGTALDAAVRDDLIGWAQRGGAGAVVAVSGRDLHTAGPAGLEFSRHFERAGDWRITGRATGQPLTTPRDP